MDDHEQEQVEVTFFIGEWMPTLELADQLEAERRLEESLARWFPDNGPPYDDDVEFVSPVVPGKMLRGLSREDD
jgi:hypothetical protein